MINVEVIKHKDQRYETCGDWYTALRDYELIDLQVKVSDTGDSHYNQLIAVHEIVEAILCTAHGIPESYVTEWDKANPDSPDPGSIPGCPYYRQHMIATMIERVIAAELDINWNDYEATLERLGDQEIK